MPNRKCSNHVEDLLGYDSSAGSGNQGPECVIDAEDCLLVVVYKRRHVMPSSCLLTLTRTNHSIIVSVRRDSLNIAYMLTT
jgi:hypothetical protein